MDILFQDPEARTDGLVTETDVTVNGISKMKFSELPKVILR